MRIGLFTEQDSCSLGGVAATVDPLVAHRPHDATIHRYSAVPDVRSVLSARELIGQAWTDRIDVVHVASTGPLAAIALLAAWRFGLPVIGSFTPTADNAPAMRTSYLRALVRQSRRLLVTSIAARGAFLRAGVGAAKVMVWRPGVDASRFAPSRRSAELRAQW